MLLVGRHSVTRSDMVVIKKAKTKKAKKIKGQFQSEQFCQEKGNRGENPKNNPRQKKAISNMKQRKKIPGLPSSVKYQILDFLFIHYIREKQPNKATATTKNIQSKLVERKRPSTRQLFFNFSCLCVCQSVQRRNLLQNASTARQGEK